MARGDKNRHKRELRALVDAEHHLDEIVMALIMFSNQKTEGHFCVIREQLHGLRDEIKLSMGEKEVQLKKDGDIVHLEVSRKSNIIERMVREKQA